MNELMLIMSTLSRVVGGVAALVADLRARRMDRDDAAGDQSER